MPPLHALQTSLLGDEPLDPVALAEQATLRGRDGHWDELHGRLTQSGASAAAPMAPLPPMEPMEPMPDMEAMRPMQPMGSMSQKSPIGPLAPSPPMAPLWQRFWQINGVAGWQDLQARADRVRRRVQEDGASYNVYSDEVGGGSASHVWPLELLPLLIKPSEWTHIEAGVRQRAKLLNATLSDVYGPARLLADGLLPASLVLAHPQYLRPLKGCVPLGGVHMHLVAFDLARAPDGMWWVVGQRTQAPSGLGYMLENRLLIAEQFPEAFRDLGVQRLAGAFRTLLQGLIKLAPPPEAGEPTRVALLSPGPHNETYFEHAFLARYLGLALVEGGDLTVRNNRVYLKTLLGLERVHVLLRRVDDEYLDPLELRADSALGIPGLVQSLRAGEVVVANTPGAGWLESPGLSAFWPGVAKALLNEDLLLPASGGWWCGEAAAWAKHRSQLADFVVAPTFPSSETTRAFTPFLASELDAAALMALQARIDADPTAHTLKDRVRPAKQPVWRNGHLEPRAAVLRVFAVCDGDGGWTVLPGGLTRVAQRRDQMASSAPDALLTMQAGCASVDTWVLTDGPVDRSSLLPPPLQPTDIKYAHRTVTSRSAENLFWLGRYTERAENTLRLARWTLSTLSASARGAGPQPLLHLLDGLARFNGLVNPLAPPAARHPRQFEAELLSQLAPPQGGSSVGWNLRALAGCAQALRERLSTEHWQLIQRVGQEFERRVAAALPAGSADVATALADTDTQLAALTGAQTDRMTHDDGWRVMSIGRQIERLHYLADVLHQGFTLQVPSSDEGFALLLSLFDSTITYRAQFQGRRELPPLLHLLVIDPDNPRSLARVARTLVDRFNKLARHEPEWAASVAAELPDTETWSLNELAKMDASGQPQALLDLLAQCRTQALGLSAHISQHLFAHVAMPERRVWQ